MGLPDIVKECFFTVLMMYVLCLEGFFPGSLNIWLTITRTVLLNTYTCWRSRSVRQTPSTVESDPSTRDTILLPYNRKTL